MLALCSSLLLGFNALPAQTPRRTSIIPAVSMVAADPSQLYSRLDVLLRRARSRSEDSGLAARASRMVSNQWMDSPAERLVEATLVSGKLLLDNFDEGLELLLLAEEESELSLSSSAYTSLMRIGLVEDRNSDVLALLGRLQARGAEYSAGSLLNGMKAAAAMEDWGAVARLFSMMSMEHEADSLAAEAEAEAAAAEALELELVELDPKWSNERKKPLPTMPDMLEAFELALRAHCERGDVPRALGLIEGLRDRGRPLSLSAYKQLAALARRTKSPGPILALTPADALATAGSKVEPMMWEVRNRVDLAASNLGTIERAAVIALPTGLFALWAVANLLGFGQPKPEVDPFAGW